MLAFSVCGSSFSRVLGFKSWFLCSLNCKLCLSSPVRLLDALEHCFCFFLPLCSQPGIDKWFKEKNPVECRAHHKAFPSNLVYFVYSLMPSNICFWIVILQFFFYIYTYIYIYLFWAVLGLRCCTRAFSSCGKRGLLFVAVRGLLIAMASLVAEHRL